MRFARLLLLAALPLAVVPLGCSKGDSTTATNTAPSAPAATSGGASGGTSGGTGGDVAVTIKDFKFGPDPVTVKSGQTITFTNDDSSPHEPTAGTPTKKTGTFGVETAANGKATTPPIQLAAGTYDYFCALHEYMVAKITVQ